MSATLQRLFVGVALCESVTFFEAISALVFEGAFLPILSQSRAIAVLATFPTIPIQTEAFACLVFIMKSDALLTCLGHVSDFFVFLSPNL